MSLSKTTKSYSYRSVGGGNADINIDYTHDLSALSRLEVSDSSITCLLNYYTESYEISDHNLFPKSKTHNV